MLEEARCLLRQLRAAGETLNNQPATHGSSSSSSEWRTSQVQQGWWGSSEWSGRWHAEAPTWWGRPFDTTWDPRANLSTGVQCSVTRGDDPQADLVPFVSDRVVQLVPATRQDSAAWVDDSLRPTEVQIVTWKYHLRDVALFEGFRSDEATGGLIESINASLYFLRSLLRTLCLLIQMILAGILAFLVPFLLPVPVCLPFLLASCILLTLDLECI